MANEIQAAREAIGRALVDARPCPEGRSTERSPCGRYDLEVDTFRTEEIPTYIAVAVIRNVASREAIATIRCNDDRCFHAWVARAGRDYLLLSEDLEGQTVVDLASGEVAGYSSPDDPFIWAEYHPSPDGARLAIIGCYWACPFLIKVYDFREPLDLPLPVLAEFSLPKNDAKFGNWTSADSFTVLDRDGNIHGFDLKAVEPRA